MLNDRQRPSKLLKSERARHENDSLPCPQLSQWVVMGLQSLSNTCNFFFSSSFGNYLANSQMWPDTAPEILEMSDDDVNYDGWPWPYSDYYL